MTSSINVEGIDGERIENFHFHVENKNYFVIEEIRVDVYVKYVDVYVKYVDVETPKTT